MHRSRAFIHMIKRQSGPMQLLLGVAMSLTGLMFFSMGVGGAAITEAVVSSSRSPQPILLEQSASVRNPTTTLRVDIVREGEIICSGSATPSIIDSQYETRYSISKPIANCPPLSAGDTVRSTWIQSSEVNISLRD